MILSESEHSPIVIKISETPTGEIVRLNIDVDKDVQRALQKIGRLKGERQGDVIRKALILAFAQPVSLLINDKEELKMNIEVKS
jgi:hypothetical protein